MITTLYGYLEAPYLVGPYLLALATGATQTQLDQKIFSSKTVLSEIDRRIDSGSKITLSELDQRIDSGSHSFKVQLDQRVEASESINTELDRRIDSGSKTVLMQVDKRIGATSKLTHTEIDQRIDSGSKTTRSQIDQKIFSSKTVYQQLDRKTAGLYLLNSQLDQRIFSGKTTLSQIDLKIGSEYLLKTQLDRKTVGSSVTRMEIGRGSVSHQICNGYLVGPYLMENYLATFMCAHMRTQLEGRLEKTLAINSQLDRRIYSSAVLRSQLERRIEDTYPLHSQLKRISAARINSQILFSIYNTTNLRILCDFPSRGTSGTNWTVIAGGTAAGDRGINNVNTDIVEQVYRSTATSVTIQCDTQIPQGIFNDTLAILGHNFTTSATVIMQGSNDVTFSSIPLSETLTVERENIYWVSQYLPLQSYRYWRFTITDVTNTAGFLQIGTIVFGSSIIFNGECFTDEVVRKKTHFADRIRTEGYSSVSNDRALKKGLSLRFQKLNYNRENYENLVDVIDTARTSLKCLWIPTPQYASRYAVFAKLAEMPIETHRAISQTADYIDMDINLDEAL